MEKTMTAGEVLTSGWCPGDCVYCYIPKSEQMKALHEEIVERLQSGKYLDELEAVYGKNLQYLGFWGTEPVLTLPIIEKRIPEIFQRFPKLEFIGFSTSMLLDESVLENFIRCLIGRPIKLSIQISLDGPPWITDTNRAVGSADFIPKRFLRLVEAINDVDLGKLNVQFSFKPTHSIDNIQVFNRDKGKFKEYFEYFDRIIAGYKRIKKNKQVTLQGAASPTLVVPGKYTSLDGREFAEYLRQIHKLDRDTAYTSRLKRLFKFQDELYKKAMFTCSGGDSNFGVSDGRFHICHRTFYYDNEKYIEAVLREQDMGNWDVSVFNKGMVDHIVHNFIVPPEHLTRFRYVLRGYHDFWELQFGYTAAMVTELALCGQADERYLTDEELMTWFVLFINGCLSCPMENLLNTGTLHFQTLSMIRLWSNGAFQELLRRFREVLKSGKGSEYEFELC